MEYFAITGTDYIFKHIQIEKVIFNFISYQYSTLDYISLKLPCIAFYIGHLVWTKNNNKQNSY